LFLSTFFLLVTLWVKFRVSCYVKSGGA
jgi:hypothetical protein